jgi:hypothetical protein
MTTEDQIAAMKRWPEIGKLIHQDNTIGFLSDWCSQHNPKEKGPKDMKIALHAHLLEKLKVVPRSELEDATAEQISTIFMEALMKRVKGMSGAN